MSDNHEELRRCQVGNGCDKPAAYVIRYDEDYVGGGFAACIDCTAEARANDPLGYIESISSLREGIVTRPKSEIRRDLATEEGRGALSRRSPIGRLCADVPSLLDENERLSAELNEAQNEREALADELSAEVAALRAERDHWKSVAMEWVAALAEANSRISTMRAALAIDAESWRRTLARHQLATILPGGVLCTCGAELAALNAPFDDETIKGEPLALATHQLQEMEAADARAALAADSPEPERPTYTINAGWAGWSSSPPGPVPSVAPKEQR